MKAKNDYFAMMENLCGYSVQAAEKLMSYLKNFSPNDLGTQRIEIHRIEHSADEAQHQLLRKLSKEFITPIERDDILRLVQFLDDVTDAIEDVVIDLYMFQVRFLPSETGILAELMLNCVKALHSAVSELRNFKKPERLMTLLVEVNTLETKADEVYVQLMHTLIASARDPMTIWGIREIYDGLESCCDLCEDAANVIEYTILANT